MASIGNIGSRPRSSRSNFATLDDLRFFLNHACPPGWQISYSADIGIWSGAKFCITLKRRYARVSESSVGFDRKDETSRTFDENLLFFDVIRTMVACPSWTRGDFVFRNESDFVPELKEQMVQLFALLGSSHSLSTADILFDRFYHSHLPRLLSPLRSLETLTLDARPMSLPEHAESIAEFLEQTSTLKSCTLILNSFDSISSLETILGPFTTASRSPPLKSLILSSRETNRKHHQAFANLVHCNTSLHNLELCCSYSPRHALIASALKANHTLREFGFPISSSSELQRLLRSLQANTSLFTLKLFPTSDYPDEEFRIDFMNELAGLLTLNNTLQAIIVSRRKSNNSWKAKEKEQTLEDVKALESETWSMLRSAKDNELLLNTSLNTLVVENWELVRLENGWDVRYGGPCLSVLTYTPRVRSTTCLF